MSKITASFLSLFIICGLSFGLGYFLSAYPLLTIPLCFSVGFFGGPVLRKALVKVKSK